MSVVQTEIQNEKESFSLEVSDTRQKSDFKMVTFTLAGKDYGINVLRVKEITESDQFTHVPNSLGFVKGVYNLRGDIVSIIDLRRFFGLPAAEKRERDSIILLDLGGYTLGIVVDTIEYVIGVNRADIQPSHRLLEDVNVRYIDGILREKEKMYIILAVNKMFHKSDQESAESERWGKKEKQDKKKKTGSSLQVQERTGRTSPLLSFICEGLEALGGFFVSELNKNWLDRRFGEWEEQRVASDQEVQLTTKEETQAFLSPFFSSCKETFWKSDFVDFFSSLLPETNDSALFTVWNPGCAQGHESYFLACLLKQKYPEIQLKIRASDKDLLKISAAPNLAIEKSSLCDSFQHFLMQGKDQRWRFTPEIRDHILFEFHDIVHGETVSKLNLVVMRDVLSFVPVARQREILDEVYFHLKSGGFLILGDNERVLDQQRWEIYRQEERVVYKKRDTS